MVGRLGLAGFRKQDALLVDPFRVHAAAISFRGTKSLIEIGQLAVSSARVSGFYRRTV